VIKPLYEHHVQLGRNKMDTIGICMHKILRIVYGMLKNNCAFDPKIDMANKRRALPVKVAEPRRTERRFQEYEANAPISRRQNKKRMERGLSQSVNDTERGIKAPVPISDVIAEMLSKL
jgi:hypothetical protein